MKKINCTKGKAFFFFDRCRGLGTGNLAPPSDMGRGQLTTVYSRVDAHPGRRDHFSRSARGTGRNPARLTAQ
jgi:hypothetical protein